MRKKMLIFGQPHIEKKEISEVLNTLKSGFIQLRKNEPPAFEMLSGAAIAFAAILLIIPGFVTDLLGIIMLVKSLRGYVWNYFVIKKNFNQNYDVKKNKEENIIEAEYKDLDEK